jgi:two-component system sensor histidine kinase HydH
MTAAQTFTLVASAAFLGLAALAVIRGARNPLALPLALLCVDLFAYNVLEAFSSFVGSEHGEWIEGASAAMSAPLLAHFTLAFLGARREQRVFLVLCYAYFALIALSSLSPFVAPSLHGYPGGKIWALAMLAGIAPSFLWVFALLTRHYRASGSTEERARTQLLFGTIVIGVGGPATDLVAIAGASWTPQLASGGMLLSAILLTALALRFRLLRGTIALLAVNAALIGIVGVVLHLLVFAWVGTETAALVVGTVAVTLVLLGAARTVWSSFTTYRERTAHLATLGRLSAQMAHDIRNPLAAIHGAAQYLDTERERGGRIEEHREFLDLILDQTARLERVVRDYQRLGRAEPAREPTDVQRLVRSVADGARVSEKAAAAGVEVHAQIEALDAPCAIDGDLVTAALENLVRNAIEAMEEQGGRVTVRAERRFEGGRDCLRLTVSDDGPGMDARTREQAEEAFFTTKATGTGLGLAFVRRVAEAHGGRFIIESALGRGTKVALVLPCDARVS